jgi:hypothetical protein
MPVRQARPGVVAEHVVSPTSFMSGPTATLDTPLQQAWMPVSPIQTDGLAARLVDRLFQA